MRTLLAVEILLWVTGIGFAIVWAFNPQGAYEPYVVLSMGLAGGIEIFGRFKYPESFRKNWNSIRGWFGRLFRSNAEPAKLPPYGIAGLFSIRFAEAFPGLRSIKWFEGREAVKRLAVLLRDPLSFQTGEGETAPIWWWRDGNLYIRDFEVLNKDTVLLDSKELKIGRIAAVPSPDYYRSFVYVEALAMSPCGAYEWSEKKIAECVKQFGYAWEEYGLYKGKHAVSRAEYDDNAAEIEGKLVKLGDKVALRERFLTPYNLVLAPNFSAINNPDFDASLRSHMDGMLRGEKTIEELAELVRNLPKPRWPST